MARNYSDTAPATTLVGTGGGVASGLTNSDTTMELGASLSAFLTPTFALRLEPGTANEEMVLVTSGAGSSGSPYAITRAQGTTTAKSHATGVAVTHGIYSADFGAAGVHGLAVAQRISGAPAGKTGTPTAVSNTTTETVLATVPIAANEALAGSVYRIVTWVLAIGVTGTPTLTLRLRSGNGVSGTALTSRALTADASVAGAGARFIRVEAEIVQMGTPGATAQWAAFVQTTTDYTTAAAGTVAAFRDSFGASTLDSTVQRDLVFTAQWGAASSSNTFTPQGGYGERVF